jgi:hypothetical protein
MTAKILGLVALSPLSGAIANAQTFTATELSPLPGGTYTYGAAINNAGQVVGYGNDFLSSIGALQESAVIWNGTTPTPGKKCVL